MHSDPVGCSCSESQRKLGPKHFHSPGYQIRETMFFLIYTYSVYVLVNFKAQVQSEEIVNRFMLHVIAQTSVIEARCSFITI